MVSQLCDYTKNHLTVYFTRVSFHGMWNTSPFSSLGYLSLPHAPNAQWKSPLLYPLCTAVIYLIIRELPEAGIILLFLAAWRPKAKPAF